MAGRAAILRSWVAAAPLLALLHPAPVAAKQEPPAREAVEPASIAGTYDGSQMEMAAWLELGDDGRYRYALSYGAIDEYSTGTWTRQDGGIVLNSDPSTPPQFELLGTEQGTGAPDAVTLHLEGTGNLPISVFSAVVERDDGTSSLVDFSDGALEIPVVDGGQFVSISLALPIYEIRGEAIPVPEASGKSLYFAFHANSLGFKAFDNAGLFESDGMFLLERYGREIAFHKVGD